MRRCRECGCLDEIACVRDGLLGIDTCWWSEIDLCSACAPLTGADGEAWTHPPRSITDQLVAELGERVSDRG